MFQLAGLNYESIKVPISGIFSECARSVSKSAIITAKSGKGEKAGGRRHWADGRRQTAGGRRQEADGRGQDAGQAEGRS
jgi:hypothetical protein